MLAFVFSLVVANMLSPLSPEIMAAGAVARGFLSAPMAFLFNAAVNGLILVWAARRSSFKGLGMVGQLFILSFGTQVFMTQIETGYFVSAFPLLHDNFQLYNLIWRGLLTSLFFSVLVTWICGGFSRKNKTSSDVLGHYGQYDQAKFLVICGLYCSLYVVRLFCSMASEGATLVLWWSSRTEWLF